VEPCGGVSTPKIAKWNHFGVGIPTISEEVARALAAGAIDARLS